MPVNECDNNDLEPENSFRWSDDYEFDGARPGLQLQ